MKPLWLLSRRIRALICALSLGVAPQIAWAQPPNQTSPQTPQRAIDPDAEVALPAQFSAPQFFDAIAQATDARIVAPIPNDQQLGLMRQLLGGRAFTIKKIFAFYEQLLGYRFADSRNDDDLIKIRLPDETIYPMRPLAPRYEPFLRLLNTLSTDQITQMYLRGLTTQELTPAQIPFYLEARRANPTLTVGLTKVESLTDEQILAQPLRFRFAFQAIVTLLDHEEVWPMGVYDYGTGLIWDAQVKTDNRALARDTNPEDKNQSVSFSDTSKKSRLVVLDFPQTQTTTVGEALDAVEGKLGQKIVFNASLSPQQFRAQPIVITAGRYRADELMTAVAASAGLESLFRNDLPTLQRRVPQSSFSRLPPLVEQAQQKLRRLPFEKAGLPFFPSDFENRVARFSELTGSARFYLRARLRNENRESYDKIDLSEGRVRFDNNLFFIGSSGGSLNAPFVTSSLQLW